MIAETSREAYHKLKKLGEKQQTVLDTLGELGIASNQDVADALGWSINRVTGRMKELREAKYVVVHGVKTNQFGNSVKTWCVADPQKHIDLESDPAEDIKDWKPQAISWL